MFHLTARFRLRAQSLARNVFLGVAGLLALVVSTPTLANELGHGLLCRCQSAQFLATGMPEDLRYAPDRRVDVLHMALDVTPDFAKSAVSGTMTLSFKPIAQPLEELRLNAVDLNVHEVKSSAKIASHQVTDDAIVITFAKAIAPGQEATVTVRYSAFPQKGLYFRTPAEGYKAEEMHVWTQGETHEARHWYPGVDFPNEKFTTEMTCRVPEGMTVLSNGRQVSAERDAKTGLVAVRWRQEKPHVNYLVTLVAGHYRKITDEYRGIPLTFYTPPSDIGEAANSFRGTKEMMAFFEKEIGVPYPWAQYGQVVVHDFHWGGMENTAMTTLTDRTLFRTETENLHSSEGLVAHELAHQWFGDLVTCKDWSHIWLNEGFATYYAHLWDEHAHGRDEMNAGLFDTLRSLTSRTDTPRAIVSRRFNQPDDQFRAFGHLAYGKGGWILHMLRSQLGEDLYRQCVKTYVERRAYDTAVTQDLLAVIEELSGRSFDRFFDQWLYHAHHPELDVAYAWDEKARLAKISVRQTQKTNDSVMLFQFPLPVRFKGKAGTVEKTFEVNAAEHDFYVPLKQAPEIVRIDPGLTLLAKINFKPPQPMLLAQLTDKDDMLGRWLAVEELSNRKDADTVARLKGVLQKDPFYGVRGKAAESLRKIHTEEALDALIASLDQPDARARNAVVSAIGGFYQPRAEEAHLRVIGNEKNPGILVTAINGLGTFGNPELREILTRLLRSESYRNRLADAAIAAMRRQDDPHYVTPLLTALRERQAAFMSRGFATALDTLAFLARRETSKDAIREFLTSLVNHPKEAVQIGAIKALGTLEDPRALAVLETFSTAAKDSPEQREAGRAIEILKGARKPVDNLQAIRAEVSDLQKDNRRLSKELDDLKKKLDARPAEKKE
jgi:aminopeptidase N